MKARILLLLFSGVIFVCNAVAQTPRYQVGPGEYNCLILDNATHQAYTTLPGVPTLVTGVPSYIKAVMCGAHHWMVIDNTGSVYTWGTNINGECGVGTITPTVNVPTQITTDVNGNPFNNVVQILGGGPAATSGWATGALKADGTVWVWGNTTTGMRGDGTYGGNDPRPVQVPFPAGVVIKKIQFDYIGIALDANGNVWTWGGSGTWPSPYQLGTGNGNPDYNTPHMLSLPGPAKDIAGGYLWHYALLANGSLYGWGYYNPYLGIGTGGMAGNSNQSYSPQLLDAQLNLPHPVSKIYTNNCATYAILTDSTLWAWGDDAVGSVGNGQEINYATYKVPYAWDWGLGEMLVQKPVPIGEGLHSFTDIFTSSALDFYTYAEDVHGQLYGWGRNKGAVISNGVVAADGWAGSLPANYPNSWDVPYITALNPFAIKAPIPSPSPFCLGNPGSIGCNLITLLTTAAPNVSAGPTQNISTSTTTLQATASGNGGATPVYTIWTQVSGPNTALITIPSGLTAQLSRLVTGTYVFKMTVTDNNWRVNSSTVTINVNLSGAQPPTVSAGSNQTITLPTSSATLTGTATGNGGATIASTAWTQVSGPGTATIASASGLSTPVSGLIQGTYTFKLTATDNNAQTSTATVTVTVNAVTLVPPTVSAGSGQTITLPTSSVTLTGTATGNGGATIASTTWSQVSGPGTATIASASGLSTGVSGLTAGTWSFQLTAKDNNGQTSTATVTITVNGALVPPTVGVGSNQTITLPTSSVTLTGTATGNGGATIASTAWTQVSGPGTATIASVSGLSTQVSGLIQGTYTFKLTATDNNAQTSTGTVTVTVNAAPVAPSVSAGSNLTITLPVNSVVMNGSANGVNGATISSTAWTQVSGPNTATIVTPSSLKSVMSGLIQGTYTFQLSATDNNGLSSTGTLTVTVNAALPVPSNVPPTVSAGTDITVQLPTSTAALSGNAVGNGGATITSTAWTQVSGPNTALIGTPSSASTSVSGLVAGTYVFQLSAVDNNALTASSTVTVVVKAANIAPTVSAGSDITIQLPASTATLSGSAAGNGGATITSTAWTQSSGPNTALIGTPSGASTTVGGLVAGTYVFQLSAVDNNGVTGWSTVNVIVKAATIAPTVSAGSDITVQLPTSTATLSGSATGNGGATIASTAWKQLSGPNTALIGAPSGVSTTLSGLAAGTYVFQLSAVDNNGVTGWSTVNVVVQAANNNIYPTASAGSDITIQLPTSTATLSGSAAGNGGATITSTVWTQASGPGKAVIGAPSSLGTTVSGLVAGIYVFQLSVQDNKGLTGWSTVNVVVKAANTTYPGASAGSDITVQLPTSTATLSGSATGNGGATIVSTAWTQVSGPGTAVISVPSNLSTTVSGLVAGTYVFQLSVQDNNGLSGWSTVKVVVKAAPVNKPPVANAGPDQTVVLPQNSTVLDGTKSYDPDGTIVAYTWYQSAGKGGITIANSNTATPEVYGLQQGQYTFVLVVTDNNGATAQAQVVITVNATATTPTATLTANAGKDTTISAGVAQTLLNGSASSAVNTTISGYSWQQVSGPSSAMLLSPGSVSTTAGNLMPGSYVFQLTISDAQGDTASATVRVTVMVTTRVSHTGTGLFLYPNPATDVIHLRVTSDSAAVLVLKIYDLKGNVVQMTTATATVGTSETPIYISRLARGVYYLQVISDQGQTRQVPFIKQ